MKTSANKKLPTLCFMNTVQFWGGGEQIYLDYIQEFQKRGYPVCVICDPVSELFNKLKPIAGSIHLLLISRVNTKSFLNPIMRRKVKNYLIEQQVDIFMCSTSQDVKLGGLAAFRANVPMRIFRRGLAKEIKSNILNRFIFSKAITHLIANSNETKKLILKNLGELIPESKISVCYNGIQIPELLPKTPSPYLRIGNAGRLTEQKGQKDIIPIALELQNRGLDFKIQIAGKGELKRELKALIQENQLEQTVELIGFQEDVAGFMAQQDVFLMTSQWEGFGLVLAEAQLQELPVVGYHVTSNPEVVKEGETGFLVENRNIQAICDRIELFAKQEDLRNQMGKAARKWIIESFEFQKSIQDIEQVFQLGNLEHTA